MKTALFTIAMVFALACKSFAQVPFYTGGAVASDPVIAVATDGVSLSVERAVVSQDRKYVTLDMDPQQTTLGGFRNFTFQRAGLGFVGSAAAQAAVVTPSQGTVFGPSAKPATLTPSVAATPSAVGKVSTIAPSALDRPGMTLISN